ASTSSAAHAVGPTARRTTPAPGPTTRRAGSRTAASDGRRVVERRLDHPHERGARHTLQRPEADERQAARTRGALPLDAQLVGLRAPELKDRGRLFDGHERWKLIQHPSTPPHVVQQDAIIALR